MGPLTVEAGGSLPLFVGLLSPALVGWLLPCLIVFFKVMFACSLLGAFFFSDGIGRRRRSRGEGTWGNCVLCREGNGGQDVLCMRIFYF